MADNRLGTGNRLLGFCFADGGNSILCLDDMEKKSMIHYTAHSETGKIKSLFLKNAAQAFVNEAHIDQYWKKLNFLGKPDYQSALKEYEKFQSFLKMEGAEIHSLPRDPEVNMDSIYCRDASIATNKGMIICNMGKKARAHEPAAERIAFEAAGIPILGSIYAPGTLEGGDVAWLDENTLAVGHTYRSNEDGIKQLTELLVPLGVRVITVPLPHYKGPADVFHLMSILSPVDTNLAVVYSPLMPIAFRNLLLGQGYQLIEVPNEEFDSMGCNVLAIAPRICLMVDGNPITRAALEKAGCAVWVYKGEDISVKGGGGPTCLTRPVYRYT
jgi:N-dimethylarginine dimethylaminohydrolase